MPHVNRWVVGIAGAAVLLLATSAAQIALAESFEARLARIDEALKKNPHRAPKPALESCLRQRNFAARLYFGGHTTRAERRLAYCFEELGVSERPPAAPVDPETTPAVVQAKAAQELRGALSLKPDLANGLKIYRECAECHTPEGWGLKTGLVPQIAGQHRAVVIKQLADIRAGNRETVLMAPYAALEVIGGVQAVADVAGYIDTLELTTQGGKGPGDDLARGEALYQEHCLRCHGAAGEGNADEFVPRIQAQHFNYLVRQFEWIREGQRRNANAEMQKQIAEFDEADTQAILDFVSRIEPDEELVAPPNWRNPDFASAE